MDEFITLTHHKSQNQIRVNLNNIVYYAPRDTGAILVYAGSNDNYFIVNESPDQIDQLVTDKKVQNRY